MPELEVLGRSVIAVTKSFLEIKAKSKIKLDTEPLDEDGEALTR